MNMFRAFMELDKLHESFNDRQELIAELRALGKDYRFDKYSDKQLYSILERVKKEKQIKDVDRELYKTKAIEDSREKCGTCNTVLNPMGQCPKCDIGEEDLEDLEESNELSNEHAQVSVVDRIKQVYETGMLSKLPVGRANALTCELYGPDKERLVGYFRKQPEFNYELNTDHGIVSHEFISDKYDIEIFDSFIQMYKIPQNESMAEGAFDSAQNISSWTPITGTTTTTNNTQVPPIKVTMATASQTPNVVTIVYDTKARKLRARATDGVHGEANVAFPNALRTRSGLQYEVEELIWNGKNYRVSGKITPINNSVSNTQNINENINKEINKMNFQTILEELDCLYEEKLPEEDNKTANVLTDDEPVKEACTKALKEDTEDSEDVIDVVDDEEDQEDEPTEDSKQVILECSKCGALTIKDEADITTDEKTELVNKDEACAFCEEAAGYAIVGVVAPYEAAEGLDEGIFGLGKKKNNKKTSNNTKSSNTTEYKVKISLYNENGTCKLSHVFTELSGKMSAEDQFLELLKNSYPSIYREYKSSPKKSDWSYERKSEPSHHDDTNNKRFNPAYDIIRESIDEKDDLEELLDANVNLDASNFGGSNNNVSVLSPGGGLLSSLDAKQEDGEELEELLDANLDVNASGFCGTGNTVSVLSGGLNSSLDTQRKHKEQDEEDEELEELLDANVGLDLRGFGGSGNNVSVL